MDSVCTCTKIIVTFTVHKLSVIFNPYSRDDVKRFHPETYALALFHTRSQHTTPPPCLVWQEGVGAFKSVTKRSLLECTLRKDKLVGNFHFYFSGTSCGKTQNLCKLNLKMNMCIFTPRSHHGLRPKNIKDLDRKGAMLSSSTTPNADNISSC